MSARPKGSGWMADFMVAGTRYREFGFKTQTDADAWELTARAAIMQGRPVPKPTGTNSDKPVPSMTMAGILRHCASVHWRSRKSSAKLARTAELYVVWFGEDKPVSEGLTSAAIADYVGDLQDRERSGSTINRHLSGISVLAKHAKALGAIPTEPLIPWQSECEGRIRWFEHDEEVAILKTCRQWGYTTEAAFLMFLADTGARVGEALKLDWSDINKAMSRATFWETKAGNHRAVPITPRVREALKALPRTTRGPFSELTRHGLRGLWERLRTHYPWIKDAVLHTYRHTCASRLVQRGADLVRVKEWMGHKSIQTTLRYSHLSPKHLDDLADLLGQTPANTQ